MRWKGSRHCMTTNFGIQDDEPPKFKGTMELAGEAGRRMGV